MIERRKAETDESGETVSVENEAEPVQDYSPESRMEGMRMEGTRMEGLEVEEEGREAMTAVRDTMSNTLRSVGAVGDEAVIVVRDVLKEAITATEDVGAGLVSGTTHLAKDIVHGVTDLLVDVVGGIRQVAGAAMGGARSVQAEPPHRQQSQPYP